MHRKISVFLLVALFVSLPVRASDVPEVPGWNKSGESTSYDISNITDAINGAAELYIAYGFKRLTVQGYEQGDTRVNLNIFDQGSSINAYGLFRRERPPAAKVVKAGVQAAVAVPYHCMLHKGQYYVRIEAAVGELTEKLCEDLLGSVAEAMPGKSCEPKELKELPTEGRVPGSEGYTRSSYLGVGDLTRSLHAQYAAKAGQTYDVFTLFKKCGDKEDKTWEKLSGTWKPTKLDDLPALYREIPYRGLVVIAKTSRGIYGVANAGELNAALTLLKQAVPQDISK